MVVAVNGLGITQITALGASYYCLGVLAKPVVADTGWPMTTVFLGFSVALLVMGWFWPFKKKRPSFAGGSQAAEGGATCTSTPDKPHAAPDIRARGERCRQGVEPT
jgi:drug/metabolite transporter (DMT)-like permease